MSTPDIAGTQQEGEHLARNFVSAMRLIEPYCSVFPSTGCLMRVHPLEDGTEAVIVIDKDNAKTVIEADEDVEPWVDYSLTIRETYLGAYGQKVLIAKNYATIVINDRAEDGDETFMPPDLSEGHYLEDSDSRMLPDWDPATLLFMRANELWRVGKTEEADEVMREIDELRGKAAELEEITGLADGKVAEHLGFMSVIKEVHQDLGITTHE